MPILNPKALIEARKKKGWTQLQLSEATKPQINVSTISRIERGKPSRVRESTLKQFSAALGVGPSELCEAATPEADLVKLPMDSHARNALALVAKRYRVSRRLIVELAPLLFYIAAQQCLNGRRQRLRNIREAADSLFGLQSQIRHLPPHWPVDQGALDREQASIDARDLFGDEFADYPFLNDYVERYREGEDNPFAAFLNEALEKTRGSDHPDSVLDPVTCGWLGTSYGICFDEAAKIVGGDDDAAHAIVDGRVALHEMPKGTPEQRAEWARAQLQDWDSDINVEKLFPASNEEPMP